MEYRELNASEIDDALFAGFDRTQRVSQCWRCEHGRWVIRDVAFVERWGAEEISNLAMMLWRTVQTSGAVFGAFSDGVLKGFSSVEGRPFGSDGQYLYLSCLHVSHEKRRHGIGQALFRLAVAWAKAHGATKLYISAHSSVDTQAFYLALGCVDTAEAAAPHVLAEPFARQLEFDLDKLPS